jgi:hypothetical protein
MLQIYFSESHENETAPVLDVEGIASVKTEVLEVGFRYRAVHKLAQGEHEKTAFTRVVS